MRIACVYLPSFPLQAHARRAPHLLGTAFAVAGGVRIVAPSQAAWAGGVRSGMTVATAQSLLPSVEVVAQDRALEDDALRGLAEALLACSRVVDIGDAPPSARVRAAVPGFGRPAPGERVPPGADDCAHRVILLAVPPRVRGAGFGHKLLGHIMRQGFRARVGIADDCFTAYAAAATAPRGDGRAVADLTRQPQMFDQACHVVPGGGAAAFLSSLPLSLLPLDPHVARMLETLGVRTLGDFAALPPPSFSRAHRAGPPATDCADVASPVDFRALAAGDGPAVLHALHLDGPVIERIDLPHPVADPQPLAFVLRALCDRVWQRLAGRDRGALQLVLRLHGVRGEVAVATPARDRADGPLASARAMLDTLRDASAGVDLDGEIRAASLEVTATTAPTRADLDLFALPEIAHGVGQRRMKTAGPGGIPAQLPAAAPAVTALAGAARAIQPPTARGRASHAAGRRTRRSARRSVRRSAVQGELRGLFD